MSVWKPRNSVLKANFEGLSDVSFFINMPKSLRCGFFTFKLCECHCDQGGQKCLHGSVALFLKILKRPLN